MVPEVGRQTPHLHLDAPVRLRPGVERARLHHGRSVPRPGPDPGVGVVRRGRRGHRPRHVEPRGRVRVDLAGVIPPGGGDARPDDDGIARRVPRGDAVDERAVDGLRAREEGGDRDRERRDERDEATKHRARGPTRARDARGGGGGGGGRETRFPPSRRVLFVPSWQVKQSSSRAGRGDEMHLAWESAQSRVILTRRLTV